MPKYHQIGESFDNDNRPSVFQLVVEDHIQFVNPKTYGIKEEFITPTEYFVTSGDAIQKSKVLEHDLWKLAAHLRQQVIERLIQENKCSLKKAREQYKKGKGPIRPKRLRDYEKAVWAAAGQARRLINLLEKARGEACFLETEWDDHCLTVIPKNPRR